MANKFTKTELKAMQARVNRGAKLLDKKKKGWERLVKMNRLKMDSPDACVLAQEYGGFGNGMDALNLDNEGVKYLGFETTQHFRDPELMNAEYIQLGKMWRNVIRQRRLRGKQ